MKLHFRGVQVPALGSTRDKIYRDYLLHEAKIEAKKQQLMLMIAMGCTVITDKNNRRMWDSHASELYDQFVALTLGLEVAPKDSAEENMRRFYDEVLKDSRPKLVKDSKGKPMVTNLPFKVK